jgi:signal peptidase I
MIQTRNEAPLSRGPASRLRILAVGRNPKTTLVRALVLAALCVAVFKMLLLPVRVEGLSMLPAYHDHSFNFINRLPYLLREPRRGDVVGVSFSSTPPRGWLAPRVMLLKRVIGLPGETIAFVDGRPRINGGPLDEPYETGPCDWNTAPVTLGPDEYFVVGDNRSMTKEEHTFGRAERSRIVGKALL